jgi:hypothetical protein
VKAQVRYALTWAFSHSLTLFPLRVGPEARVRRLPVAARWPNVQRACGGGGHGCRWEHADDRLAVVPSLQVVIE